jgi:hypothetical protein
MSDFRFHSATAQPLKCKPPLKERLHKLVKATNFKFKNVTDLHTVIQALHKNILPAWPIGFTSGSISNLTP